MCIYKLVIGIVVSADGVYFRLSSPGREQASLGSSTPSRTGCDPECSSWNSAQPLLVSWRGLVNESHLYPCPKRIESSVSANGVSSLGPEKGEPLKILKF